MFYTLLMSTCFTFVVILLLIFIYIQYSFTYWKRKGVPYIQPSFPFGNVKPLIKKELCFGEFMENIHKELKKKSKRFGGYYMLPLPIFVPVCPDLIKSMLTTDFAFLKNRGMFQDEENDPLSVHIISLEDDKWKRIRTKITPNFTAGKMKLMFPILLECSQELESIVDVYASTGQPMNIGDLMARYTTDNISSCAFGLKCNSLKNPNEEFNHYGKLFFETTFSNAPLILMSFVMPSVMRFFKIPFTNKEIAKFFLDTLKQTVTYRETNKISRKDFLDFFIKLTHKKYVDDDGKVKENPNVLTFNEIAAQAFVIYLAGFETSSTALTFCFFELAINQDIQSKLRDEIVRVLNKYDGEITYESLLEMTYMDQVIYETLRKYPPIPMINRKTLQPYKIPGTDITLDKGILCWISVMGLHRDPELYPDPEKFDPERFSEKEKLQRHPFTYLPFGEGPRICIGIRFGVIQMKIALTKLLRHNKLHLDSKTSIPLKLKTKGLLLSPKVPIWIQPCKIDA